MRSMVEGAATGTVSCRLTRTESGPAPSTAFGGPLPPWLCHRGGLEVPADRAML